MTVADGIPQWQRVDDAVGVAAIRRVQRPPLPQTGAVQQQVTDGHQVLLGAGEGRQIPLHRVVEADVSLRHEAHQLPSW